MRNQFSAQSLSRARLEWIRSREGRTIIPRESPLRRVKRPQVLAISLFPSAHLFISLGIKREILPVTLSHAW